MSRTKKKKEERKSTKILKIDKSNQYGNAMTEHLPYGFIKKTSEIPSLLELNMILDHTFHTDKIGHLFIVDIKFHNKNEETMLFNEINTASF